MMALPPLLTGIVQDTVAEVLPATALGLVGASGIVDAAGVAEFEGLDAGPGPTLFLARTVNV